MRVISLVGARPQFVKLGPGEPGAPGAGDRGVRGAHRPALRLRDVRVVLPGDCPCRRPDVNLGIDEDSPAGQVGAMVPAIAAVIADVKPSLTIVFGDTSSTLAGALASAYAGVPVAHVEAGMRSFNRAMPEELNRVAADHLSTLLFTASRAADRNLRCRGDFRQRVHRRCDVRRREGVRWQARANGDELLRRFGVTPGGYVLATIHRAANTNDARALRRVVEILAWSAAAGHLPRSSPHPQGHRRRGTRGPAGRRRRARRPTSPLSSKRSCWRPQRGGYSRIREDCRKKRFTSACRARRSVRRRNGSRRSNSGGTSSSGTDCGKALATLDLPAPAAASAECPYGDGTAGERMRACGVPGPLSRPQHRPALRAPTVSGASRRSRR